MRALDRILKGRGGSQLIPLVAKIKAMFANGEQGAWYDPSDLTTLFQDSAGTTPVTAVEQPVGLMLDKSKGLVLGVDSVPINAFSSASGWSTTGCTVALVGSDIEITATQTGFVFAEIALGTVSSKNYLLNASYKNGQASGNTRVGVTHPSGNSYTTTTSSTTTVTGSAINIYGKVTLRLLLNASAIGQRAYLSSASVRELPGNHAFQSTSASRPVLSARVNLLTKTEQFDDEVWTKVTDTVTANQGIAPDGTLTADLWTHTTGRIQRTATLANSVLSIFIKPISGSSTISLNTAGLAPEDDVVFNLSTLTVTSLGSNNTSATITSVGNGWTRLAVTRGATVGSTLYLGLSSPASSTLIWGADLRVANDGVGIPAYQRVNTSTDYDTRGFPLYLKTDGVDDGMLTNSIDPGAVDKAQVFAGVRKLSDAETGTLVELSVNFGSNNGAFVLRSPDTGFANDNNYTLAARGNNNGYGTLVSYVAPITNAVTALFDIGAASLATEIQGRVNGVPVALTESGGSAGTGNFGTYPLYLFRRGGTTLPFNGRCYGLIVRFGPNLSAGQIASTEKYINSKTKAY